MASAPIQLAMADFIGAGHYNSHLRNIKQIYKGRGEQLAAQLKEKLDDEVKVLQSNGGVQLVIYFKRKVNDVALASAVQEQGLNVTPLSSTYQKQSKSGLIIGYGQASLKNINLAISIIERALNKH